MRDTVFSIWEEWAKAGKMGKRNFEGGGDNGKQIMGTGERGRGFRQWLGSEEGRERRIKSVNNNFLRVFWVYVFASINIHYIQSLFPKYFQNLFFCSVSIKYASGFRTSGINKGGYIRREILRSINSSTIKISVRLMRKVASIFYGSMNCCIPRSSKNKNLTDNIWASTSSLKDEICEWESLLKQRENLANAFSSNFPMVSSFCSITFFGLLFAESMPELVNIFMKI